MRILVISNLYPPYYLGGYELACKDVIDALRERGHHIQVLTSTYGVSASEKNGQVDRYLPLYPYKSSRTALWQFAWKQHRDSSYLIHIVQRTRPELIYIWNMGNIGYPIVHKILQAFHSIPVVFAISDRWMFEDHGQSQHWIEYWQHIPSHQLKKKFKLLVKHILAHFILVTSPKFQIRYAHFFSHSLRQQYYEAGVIPENSRIIHHGVPVTSAIPATIEKKESKTLQLLYSGRIDKIKGVHTAIEALSILIHHKKMTNFSLTIVGSQEYADYVTYLSQLIEQHKLHSYVKILDKVPRKTLMDIYKHHDILLFPSIWEEPFSITILEAMAHGLVVISTPTGGSAEILRHRENSLLFPPENAKMLANQIETLANDPELAANIRLNAFQTILKNFSLKQMIDSIEQYLLECVDDFEKNVM